LTASFLFHYSPHFNRGKFLPVGEKIVGAVSDMMKILLKIVKTSNWVSLYLCAVKKNKSIANKIFKVIFMSTYILIMSRKPSIVENFFNNCWKIMLLLFGSMENKITPPLINIS
jgi:hypothetical protein